jgi:RpiR family carbohydrate utilization transcriptional regulator
MAPTSPSVFATQPPGSATEPPAGVLARLDSLIPGLRESERKIAEYVLARPAEVIYLSITELADRTETSEASVIRFAQRLGFPGYAALKIALAMDLRASAAPAEPEPETDIGAIKRKVLQVNIKALEDTAQLLDDAALARAVEALARARRIEVYGVGGSAAVAQDAAFSLMRVGLPVVCITDPHIQVMSAVQLREGDVALAISLSGSTRDTVEALQLARDAGATCLCITRYARSPITHVAHITLLAAARPAVVVGYPLLGRIAQLAVVDVLAAAVTQARGDASLTALARGRQAISASKKF